MFACALKVCVSVCVCDCNRVINSSSDSILIHLRMEASSNNISRSRFWQRVNNDKDNDKDN